MRALVISQRVLNPAFIDLRAMIQKRASDAFKNAQVARALRNHNRYQEATYRITLFAASNASTALCCLIHGTPESYERVELIIKGWRDVAHRDYEYYMVRGARKTAIYFQIEKAHCVRMLRLLKQLR